MNNAIDSVRFRDRARATAAAGGNDGGVVDEILKRLNALETSVSGITATIPHLATKADVASIEIRMVKWMIAIVWTSIGTALTSAGLAFAIAKYVN